MPCIGLDDTNCCTFGATVALCLLRRAANLSLRDVASWCSILRSIGKCQAKKNAHFQKSFETDKDSRSAPGLLESSSANTIWKT